MLQASKTCSPNSVTEAGMVTDRKPVHEKAPSPMLVTLYGLVIPGYWCAKIYDPIFRTLEPDEESAAE